MASCLVVTFGKNGLNRRLAYGKGDRRSSDRVFDVVLARHAVPPRILEGMQRLQRPPTNVTLS
jgi:hypothetical protein